MVIEEISWSITCWSECHHRGMARESDGLEDAPYGPDPVLTAYPNRLFCTDLGDDPRLRSQAP